jgi:hypothetical protein
MKLFSSEDLLSSPIDFINSVYNAPASQSAIALGIRGTNLTMVGISAFEQALFAMSSIGRDDSSILLVGADEWNPELSPLINPCSTEEPGDGGGAFLLSTAKSAKGPVIEPLFYGRAHGGVINKLMDRLGGGATVRECFKLVMVGWPAEEADQARLQLVEFMGRTRYKGPVIEYNRQLGHSSCAPAIAAVMSVKLIEHGSLPAAYCSGKAAAVTEARILLLTLGGYLSAVSAGP